MCNLLRFKYGLLPCGIVPRIKEIVHACIPLGNMWDASASNDLGNGPDVFQEKKSMLFAELDYVRTCIDDLLMTTKGDLNDHLEKSDVVLRKLNHAGLKINANESFFCQHEL